MPVYLIRAGETSNVKIGWSDDPEQRRRDLQTAHYEELRIIRIIVIGPQAERWMHRRYAHLRGLGEWFTFTAEMMTVDPSALDISAGSSIISLETPTGIIEALGGEVELASLLGFKYRSRVSNWRTIGIPRQHWPELLDIAASRGVELTFDILRASEVLATQVAA